MSKENEKGSIQLLLGSDLERWRIGNGLSKSEAAETFGIHPLKWDKLTTTKALSEPIQEPVIIMLWNIYNKYPDSCPIKQPPSLHDFYEFLGYSKDNPKDMNQFAIMIGRSITSIYRILVHDGSPGRPIIKWIEALLRLNKSSAETFSLMQEIVELSGKQQGIDDIFQKGWKKAPKRTNDDS